MGSLFTRQLSNRIISDQLSYQILWTLVSVFAGLGRRRWNRRNSHFFSILPSLSLSFVTTTPFHFCTRRPVLQSRQRLQSSEVLFFCCFLKNRGKENWAFSSLLYPLLSCKGSYSCKELASFFSLASRNFLDVHISFLFFLSFPQFLSFEQIFEHKYSFLFLI